MPTLLELAREWFEATGGRLSRPEDVERHIQHLKPLWGLTEPRLKPALIEKHLYGLLAPDGILCPTTVNKVLGTARRIIRWAMANDRWGPKNPFALVDRLKQAKPVTRSLTLAEFRAMLPHLRQDRRREALCMLYLGLRPGELKALQLSDIDIQNQTLTVHRSNGRNSTKTGKVRVLPIPRGLWPHLEAAIKATPSGCQLVFPNKDGGRQRADAKLSRALRWALSEAGLVAGWTYSCRRKGCGYRVEEKGQRFEVGRCPRCNFCLWEQPIPLPVRFYDLRHSAASLHREAGADPLAIQICLGHAPETLTDSVYTHMSFERIRAELNKLRV